IYDAGEIAELFAVFTTEFVGLSRMEQRRSLDLILTEDQTIVLIQALNELKSGKPFQQILGKTEFYGVDFIVTEDVLVPRPETEELLELAIGQINRIHTTKRTLKILDIGTGSGIIPIILKKHFPEAKVC